jgi:ribosomal protein S12 methylthiotransferase
MISLGCPKNLVDSDNLTRRLTTSGFSYVDNLEAADILLINTCGFIEDAKKESIGEILKLAELKKGQEKIQDTRCTIQDKKNHTSCIVHRASKSDSKQLIVFGCLAKRYGDELIKEIPDINAIFGVGEEDKIVEYCKKLTRSWVIGNGLLEKTKIPITHHPSPITSYAYLKISEGCSKKCSYCVIPSIRGRYRSSNPDDILKEAERLIKDGARELILVGQDTACYGKDLDDYDIADLLKDLCSIAGDFWIRLLYAYPSSIKDPLLSVIAEEDKICKYLDIPLQHSEDRILRLMKRSGTRKGYLNLIEKIRDTIPDIILRTTFIVGFPTETEEEFNSLIDFIEEVKFDRLGAFRYSKEDGTSAAKIKGQISEVVKKKRVEELMNRQSNISFKKNRELIGKKFRAIIDELIHGIALGRLYSHAPEIDGVVITTMQDSRYTMQDNQKKMHDTRYTIQDKDNTPLNLPFVRGELNGGIMNHASCIMHQSSIINHESCIMHRESAPVKVGDFVTVRITDAYDYDLKGIIVG